MIMILGTPLKIRGIITVEQWKAYVNIIGTYEGGCENSLK
jgi:hypothetical protein